MISGNCCLSAQWENWKYQINIT